MAQQFWGRAGILAGGAMLLALPAAAEEVLVGLDLPLTGAVASWSGPPIRDGLLVALDEINGTAMLGEGRSIKLLIEDDASDKAQAITLASRLITRDKVSLLIGPATTPLAAAAAPIANQLECPMLALGVSEEITRTGPWVYKIYQGPAVTMTSAARFLTDKWHVKSLAMVTPRDNEAAVAYGKIILDHVKAQGVTDITEDTVLSSETDFTALATKLSSRDFDAIYLGTLPELAANVVLQASQAGLSPKVKLIGSDQLGAQAYAKIGGKAVEGTVYPTFYFAGSTSEANTKFVTAYRKKFKADPDQYAAIGYTSMMVAAEAIRQAGPNAARTAIRDALGKIKDLPTVLGAGAFSFDANRNPTYGTVMVAVKGLTPVPAD